MNGSNDIPGEKKFLSVAALASLGKLSDSFDGDQLHHPMTHSIAPDVALQVEAEHLRSAYLLRFSEAQYYLPYGQFLPANKTYIDSRLT